MPSRLSTAPGASHREFCGETDVCVLMGVLLWFLWAGCAVDYNARINDGNILCIDKSWQRYGTCMIWQLTANVEGTCTVSFKKKKNLTLRPPCPL
jgi:hypothetical protein